MDDMLDERIGLIIDKIEHAFDRIETLEKRLETHIDDRLLEEDRQTETKRERRGVTFELIVIGLVGIETIITALMYFHHA